MTFGFKLVVEEYFWVMRVLNRGNLPVGLGVRSRPKSIYSMMQQFKWVDFFLFFAQEGGKRINSSGWYQDPEERTCVFVKSCVQKLCKWRGSWWSLKEFQDKRVVIKAVGLNCIGFKILHDENQSYKHFWKFKWTWNFQRYVFLYNQTTPTMSTSHYVLPSSNTP